jgi:uncharacterized DUF497 family protein
MRVVWDFKKAAANIRKQCVEFSHAATVLDDPQAVTIEDRRHEEQRYATVGSDILGRVVVVVYAYAGKDEIRLISARKASPRERRVYEEK